jgi:hypothetical protein
MLMNEAASMWHHSKIGVGNDADQHEQILLAVSTASMQAY